MTTGMAALLFGDEIDRNAAADREALLFAVQREITCPVSGAILDIRTAVLITITSTEETPQTLVMMVMTGDAFDKLGGIDHVRATAERFAATFEVIDGRVYTASGALRKAERAKREADLAESKRESADAAQ